MGCIIGRKVYCGDCEYFYCENCYHEKNMVVESSWKSKFEIVKLKYKPSEMNCINGCVNYKKR